MVPQPPPDVTLPGLGSALDGAVVAELLQARLPANLADRVVIISCRPEYIRYKPGTNCLVLFDLRFRDEATGDERKVPVHVRLFADDRATRLWNKARTRALAERARNWHSAPLAGLPLLLPELGGIAQIYPLDLGLAALVDGASPKLVGPRLSADWDGGAEDEVIVEGVELVRYKPARKALLRYCIGGAAPATAFAKLHSDDRGRELRDLTLALCRGGIPTPAPLAYVDDLRLLVHPAVPGEPLWTLRGTPAFASAMEPVAAALADLHAVPEAALPLSNQIEIADMTREAAAAIATVHPAVARRATQLADEISEGLAVVAPELTLIHGDCSPDQVLVDGGSISLIDFERAGLGHPLLDVGTFLAHLAVAGGEGIDGAAAAFLDAYAARRPTSMAAVHLFAAAALLGLAIGPFRRLEADWPQAVERVVGLAESHLVQARVQPSRAPAPSRIIDAALPQLAPLQDPDLMATHLGSLFGAPVEVRNAQLLRHKPGRRALLRYELRVDPSDVGQDLRLYGKTFASERGPKVCEITRMITTSRACGPEVNLPDVVGYLPDLKLLVQREVPGEPVRQALLGGDEALARRIADALHALHTSGLDLGRRHDAHRELDPLGARVETVGEICPSLHDAARRCLARVEAGRKELQWRWRPVHRDFYHDQILTGPAGLAIVDFDDAAMSEPAVDVANFLAHLRLLALQERGDAEALAGLAAGFIDQYVRHDPDLDPATLRFLEGATLVRLAAIHLPRQHGTWLAGCLLTEAERQLDHASAPIA